jgi:alkylated DNA repair dioxygenase AlkB
MLEQALFNFGQPGNGYQRIQIADAELSMFEHAFSAAESDRYLQTFIDNIPWRCDEINIHGRTIPLPRLQAWYADKDAVLHYSGMSVEPLAWTSELFSIGERVTELSGLRFNGVLLNCYRDGFDSVGWHSDDEQKFGPDPIIASVSFGATREFVLKHRFKDDVKPVKCQLTHGSLLVMGKGTQTHWKHQLPKRKLVTKPRINLTFRNMG